MLGDKIHHDKLITAKAAARLVKPGQRVFVGTACATPRTLLDALALARGFSDNVQIERDEDTVHVTMLFE